jgi:phage baseplate assembly protein gpV
MVRCIFPDMDNMTSDWLYVLQTSDDEFVPDVNDRVIVLYPFGFNTDGYVLGVIP